MLGPKTKRVAAYGRRAHRIVTTDSFTRATASGRTVVSPLVTAITLDDPV